MLKGAPFDATVVRRAATRLDIMMEMLPDAFRANTSGFHLKTNARPEIWTDPIGFDLKIHEMQAAVAKLASAAMRRDKDATLMAANATLGACRACHNKYGQGLE
jgi:cytochrome c556